MPGKRPVYLSRSPTVSEPKGRRLSGPGDRLHENDQPTGHAIAHVFYAFGRRRHGAGNSTLNGWESPSALLTVNVAERIVFEAP